jgi:hypothetical protein
VGKDTFNYPLPSLEILHSPLIFGSSPKKNFKYGFIYISRVIELLSSKFELNFFKWTSNSTIFKKQTDKIF